MFFSGRIWVLCFADCCLSKDAGKQVFGRCPGNKIYQRDPNQEFCIPLVGISIFRLISDCRFKISKMCIPLVGISIFIFHISDFRFQVSDFRFHNSDFRFHISDFGFRISDFRFHISDFRFQISGFRSEVSDFRSQTSESHFGDLGPGEPLAGTGGTRPGCPQHQCIKTLYKNPLGKPSQGNIGATKTWPSEK